MVLTRRRRSGTLRHRTADRARRSCDCKLDVIDLPLDHVRITVRVIGWWAEACKAWSQTVIVVPTATATLTGTHTIGATAVVAAAANPIDTTTGAH